MKFRTSLRYRVAFAFAFLGTLVSLLIAGSLYLLMRDMEKRLLAETLSTELEDYMARFALNPDAPPPNSTTLQTFVIEPRGDSGPAVLRQLRPGLQQIRFRDRNYFVEVREQDGRRFVVLYDETRIRQRDQQFRFYLVAGVLVMAGLSALLGFWLAGRVISPVAELVRRVSGLEPGDGQTPLAGYFPADEVGELARDFDDYLRRLSDFIERERAFTSDVSHELRTPLAVIRGATEVLLADDRIDPARRKRVERIARAVEEASELSTALLLLAREQDDQLTVAACEVGEIIAQVLQSHQYLLEHKPVEVRFEIHAQPQVQVECSLLRVVLANLVRNAFSYIEQGHVRVTLEAEHVEIEDTGVGIPSASLHRVFETRYSAQPGGEGIGLSLVRRICRRYGWQIELDSSEGRGTRIRLCFQATEET
ncbi:MAG TPA: HAMP domain-containing histidine kinase [Gammaproteobacteria bacterium]|nr:HAMP domain-containing histidine kinase [Gammaproteobacteria bacterium]